MDNPIPPIPQQPLNHPSPDAPLDIGRCFNDAIEVFKRNWFQLILATLIFELLSLCTLFILSGPLLGGIYLMCIAAIQSPDKRIDMGLMFGTFSRFAPLVGLFFLTLIPELLGLILFIVPGILLTAMWIFAFPLMIDKHMGVIDSMSASWKIVSRRGFGWNVLLAAIVFAIGIAPAFIPYLNLILGLILSPITWLIVASAYLQQVRERESDLADILSPRGFPVQQMNSAAVPAP